MSEIIVRSGEEKRLLVVHDTSKSENIVVKLSGEGAKVFVDEIFLSDSKSEVKIVHESPNTESFVFSRGAVSEEIGALTTISIPKGMIKSKSVVKQRFILLNNSAKANATPALEIEESDVVASHSSSVAPLNEKELFYLQSRGFSEVESRKILVEALLSLPEGVKWQG
jgi:Fe-S cluster assembly scaffold protein SufB